MYITFEVLQVTLDGILYFLPMDVLVTLPDLFKTGQYLQVLILLQVGVGTGIFSVLGKSALMMRSVKFFGFLLPNMILKSINFLVPELPSNKSQWVLIVLAMLGQEGL
jgi:hypothetical protein